MFVVNTISPLWKGQSSSFEQFWIPFTQRWFVPSLVEIDPVVLEKKMKMWKVLTTMTMTTTRTTDNGQILIRKAHLSLWLRWAKKVIILRCSPLSEIIQKKAGKPDADTRIVHHWPQYPHVQVQSKNKSQSGHAWRPSFSKVYRKGPGWGCLGCEPCPSG